MSNKHPESIIRKDGGLRVVLPVDAVTWYWLLSASRAATCEQGGWNGKSAWVSEGLEKLVAGGVALPAVAKWTEASLKADVLPYPRTKDFQIGQRHAAIASGKRGANECPALTSENWLNWQLSQRLYTEAKAAGDRCVTYELPLADQADGQLKADVVVFRRDGVVEIVELKRSRKHGDPDTPLMALIEGICYGLQLIRCWNSIEAELRVYLPAIAQPRAIHLLIAGPGYWRNCNGRAPHDITDEQRSQMTAIINKVAEVTAGRGVQWSVTLADAHVENNQVYLVPDKAGGPIWGSVVLRSPRV